MNKLSKSIMFLLVTDFILFISTFRAGLFLSKGTLTSESYIVAALTAFCWIYVLSLKGYYKIRSYNFIWKDSYHLLESIILGSLISYAIQILTNTENITYTLITSAIVYPLLMIWRYSFNSYIKHIKKSKNILIVGAGSAGKSIANLIQKYPKLKYNILGFIDDDSSKIGSEISSIKILGSTREIKKIVENNNIKIIVIAINKSIKTESMHNISECAGKNIIFFSMHEIFEYITSKIPVKHITPDWFIYNLTRTERPVYRLCKKIFDIAGAIIISLVTLPIMITLIISIKLADGGKIFYTQKRVGKNGEVFEMLKFRTMIEKAEENGAVWAVNNNNDPRVTKVGKIARKLRFDELPQMINILKGEMSLVGPRPERPEFTSELEKQIPFYHRRHWIKPGWTGWAQIMYKYGASVDDATEKLRYDLFYIKNRNIFFDFSILVKAVGMALSGRHG